MGCQEEERGGGGREKVEACQIKGGIYGSLEAGGSPTGYITSQQVRHLQFTLDTKMDQRAESFLLCVHPSVGFV